MAYTLDEVKVWLQSNPILTEKQVFHLREAIHRKLMDGVHLNKVFEVVELLDWNSNHIIIYKVLTDAILLYLLDDDEASILAGEIDWITETDGDTLVTKLQGSTLPNKVKKHILQEVDIHAQNILSQNLTDAINFFPKEISCDIICGSTVNLNS